MMLCLCVASVNTGLEFRNVSEKQLLDFLLVMKAFRIFTMNTNHGQESNGDSEFDFVAMESDFLWKKAAARAASLLQPRPT